MWKMGKLRLIFSILLLVEFPVAIKSLLSKEERPVFLEPVNNATVVIGRDATLTCVVDHLGPNKVAWIHMDRMDTIGRTDQHMIVTIDRVAITRIPRFSASHDNHRTWFLHLRGAQPEDAGRYMCQVNSNPMITQIGIIDVVVPPTILDSESSASHITVREGSQVALTCRGGGVPLPRVTWRREDGRHINMVEKKKETKNSMGFTSNNVPFYEGQDLIFNKVSRLDSGAYLCIASNGVPPSVSKRILLEVEFPPAISVPNQLVGSPLGVQVTFECKAEAQPKPITYWVHNEQSDPGPVLLSSGRVHPEFITKGYETRMKLTIDQLERQDMGQYRCVAKNSLGEADGTITLIETVLPTTPTLPVPMHHGNTKKSFSRKEYVSDRTDPKQYTPSTIQYGWRGQGSISTNATEPQQSHGNPLTDNGSGNNRTKYFFLPCCVVIFLRLILL